MCAYCRRIFHRRFLTKDHIPPQGIYGKEWRKGKELPWVDCCRGCRDGQSVGDDALKAVVGLGVVRMQQINRISGEVARAVRRPSWLRKQLKTALCHSEDVLLFGQIPAVKIPLTPEFSSEVYESVRRISIGVLFDWDPAWDSHSHDFTVVGKNEMEIQEIDHVFSVLADSLRFARVLADKVFIARWDFASDRPGYGLMAMTFYGTQAFFVFIRAKGDPLPLPAVVNNVPS